MTIQNITTHEIVIKEIPENHNDLKSLINQSEKDLLAEASQYNANISSDRKNIINIAFKANKVNASIKKSINEAKKPLYVSIKNYNANLKYANQRLIEVAKNVREPVTIYESMIAEFERVRLESYRQFDFTMPATAVSKEIKIEMDRIGYIEISAKIYDDKLDYAENLKISCLTTLNTQYQVAKSNEKNKLLLIDKETQIEIISQQFQEQQIKEQQERTARRAERAARRAERIKQEQAIDFQRNESQRLIMKKMEKLQKQLERIEQKRLAKEKAEREAIEKIAYEKQQKRLAKEKAEREAIEKIAYEKQQKILAKELAEHNNFIMDNLLTQFESIKFMNKKSAALLLDKIFSSEIDNISINNLR